MGILEVIGQLNLALLNFTLLLRLTTITIILVVYAVFTYFFYRLLAKKNIIELNLSKYNKYRSDFLLKIFATIFFIIEYLIIMPVVTFFWFSVLAILLFLLAESLSLELVILISAALVASVRVTSYISENLSQDLAKMLPLTLIGVAITKPGFFEINSQISRVKEIPTLFIPILYYLSFIVFLEIIMRLIDLIRNLGHEEDALKQHTNGSEIVIEEEKEDDK